MNSVSENVNESSYEYNDTIEDVIFLSKSNDTNKNDKLIEYKPIIITTEPTKPDVEIIIKPLIVIPPISVITSTSVTPIVEKKKSVQKNNIPDLPKTNLITTNTENIIEPNEVILIKNKNKIEQCIDNINKHIIHLKEIRVQYSEYESIKSKIIHLETIKKTYELRLLQTKQLILYSKTIMSHMSEDEDTNFYSGYEMLFIKHGYYMALNLNILTSPLVYLYKIKMYKGLHIIDGDMYSRIMTYFTFYKLLYKMDSTMLKQIILTPEECIKSKYIKSLNKRISEIGWSNIFNTIENKQALELFFTESYKFTDALLIRIDAVGLINSNKINDTQSQKRKAEDVESSNTESSSSTGEAKRACI
jgi:hypothetical protein